MIPPPRPRPAWVVLFFAALLACTLSKSLAKRLDHDEHQFVAAGALYARHGLLPYRDYPYFHMPNLVFVYAAVFRVSDHLLLAARVLSTLFGLGTIAAVFFAADRRFRGHSPGVRWAVAGGSALVLATNPLFTFTSGRAWNHDLPVLLTLVATLIVLRPTGRTRRAGLRAGVVGLLIGAATGTRLTFAPAVLAMGVMVLARPREEGRVRCLMAFAAGAAVGLLPAILLCAVAPRQFWFGNFAYPVLNTAYRECLQHYEPLTPSGKLMYVLTHVVLQPGNLILIGVTLALALRPSDGSPDDAGRKVRTRFLLALICFLLVGSFAPTPPFHPYFYAPVPFVILLALESMAAPHGLRWPRLLAVLALIAIVAGVRPYGHLSNLFHPGEWVPSRAHAIGLAIHRDVPAGRVLTLAPIFPLEGKLDVLPEFATGPFAARVAPMVGQDEQTRYRLLDEDDLRAVLAERPAQGVLLSGEGQLEGPLRRYAQSREMVVVATPSKGRELWCPRPARVVTEGH